MRKCDTCAHASKRRENGYCPVIRWAWKRRVYEYCPGWSPKGKADGDTHG